MEELQVDILRLLTDNLRDKGPVLEVGELQGLKVGIVHLLADNLRDKDQVLGSLALAVTLVQALVQAQVLIIL